MASRLEFQADYARGSWAMIADHPWFGVGPGNVPVLLDTSYDVPEAVAKVVSGKKFDYGTVCSSEQVLVAERSIRARVMEELNRQMAFLMRRGFSSDLCRKACLPPRDE